ncbi:hypothetical protein SEPCBS57363_005541 [Sporothrix epigloea]|uniref:3'-5' exonuclease domain-containing protein n=1 Tax=Sporothrix epigloea TaxID=1892477 RepID=A0ABP0E1R7_9PEZI
MASQSLWKPDNGVLFSTACASAPAAPSTSSLPVRQQSTSAILRQQSWPKVVYPRLPLAAYTTPDTSVVSKCAIHAGTQKACKVTDSLVHSALEVIDNNELVGGVIAERAEDAKERGESKEVREVLPLETTLDFKIPKDVFRAARDAAEGTPESYFSYAMYRRPATYAVEEGNNLTAPATVKVHYCKTKHTTDRVCNDYFKDEPLLGFDLEWMPNATKFQGARQNVCLMQIASPSRIGLFHLSLYPKAKVDDQDGDVVGPILRSMLEDASTLKVGVAIKGDATRVEKYLGVKMRGVFELSHLHKLVVHSKADTTHLINKKLVSLAVQAKEHLQLPMFKGLDVRSSDWSRTLAMDQIIYSASDAYAALQIFSILNKQREDMSPKPPLPACVELNLPIRLAGGVVAEVLDEAGESEELFDENSTMPVEEMTPEYLAQAAKTLEIEAEGDTDFGPTTPAISVAPKTKTPSLRSPRTPKAPVRSKDYRITTAEEWLAQFSATATAAGRTIRARPASLRAYHLWHNDATLEPGALAALLRDPPLQKSTVTSYILDAVKLESLPYAKTRMRDELLDQIPADLRRRRYAYLSKVCGYGN